MTGREELHAAAKNLGMENLLNPQSQMTKQLQDWLDQEEYQKVLKFCGQSK